MKPIRILNIVAIMDRGGLETMIMNHYREINRDNVQFDFLVHRSEEGAYDDEIKELGGKIYIVPKFNPFKIKNYNKAMDNFFETHSEYRIVHSHYNALSMWALRSAKKNQVPVRIAHSHLSYPKFNYQSPFYWYARKKINMYCNYRFACSNSAGKWLFGTKLDNNIHIFKNAISTNKYDFNPDVRDKYRDELNIKGKFVIGHVGRFHKSKNHNFLLEVFREVYLKNKSAHLVLVGDGPNRQKLTDNAIKLGIDKSVSFLGSRADVDGILQAMDVFVFPSLFEALPVTLVESQAAGLHTIASDSLTKEIQLTDLIEFISLDKPASYWADKVLQYKNGYERDSFDKQISDAGYDIKENTKWLENFYLENFK